MLSLFLFLILQQGVGIGEQLPSTCTPQVGFWDGVYLHKCVKENVWIAYYKPATYPHPYALQAPIIVRGTIKLVSTFTDVTAITDDTECGVDSIQFFLSFNPITSDTKLPSGAKSFEFLWDTTTTPNGDYQLESRVADKNGFIACDGTNPNIGTSNPIDIRVDNFIQDKVPPTVGLSIEQQ